jgi:hypothetical protein
VYGLINENDLIQLFKSKHHLITMDINKYLWSYNPGYQSRNYNENNFNLIYIKHNIIKNTFKTLTLSDQQNFGTAYQPKLRNPVVYVRLKLV